MSVDDEQHRRGTPTSESPRSRPSPPTPASSSEMTTTDRFATSIHPDHTRLRRLVSKAFTPSNDRGDSARWSRRMVDDDARPDGSPRHDTDVVDRARVPAAVRRHLRDARHARGRQGAHSPRGAGAIVQHDRPRSSPTSRSAAGARSPTQKMGPAHLADVIDWKRADTRADDLLTPAPRRRGRRRHA